MNLDAIWKDIEEGSEDSRFLGFMSLYESEDEAAKVAVSRIMEWRDPILKLLFLRFLAYVPEPRAVSYICTMMQDENPVILDAAKRSFDRNTCERKHNALLPLLHSKIQAAQIYAIEALSQGAFREALDSMLELLNMGNAQVQAVVLAGLRFLPSRRNIPLLHRFATDPNDDIRFNVVMALAAIYETGARALHADVVHFLEDKSPKVRQGALWGLRRVPRAQDVPKLMALVETDPDSQVRQEALVGLSQFPTRYVMTHLLNVLVTEKNRLVTLKCESALLAMDHDALVKGLSQIARKSDGAIRHRAILLMADFQRESETFFRFLVEGLKKADSDRERIVLLEALGILGVEAASLVIVPYLSGNALIAYVAMAALLRIGGSTWSPVNYLEDPSASPLLKQMVLRQMVRRESMGRDDDQRLIQCLLELLRGDNINMRYLSAQVLVRIAGVNVQEELMAAVLKETDPTASKLLRDSLVQFFTQNPAKFIALLTKTKAQPDAFLFLTDMLNELIWDSDTILEQIAQLTSLGVTIVDWISLQIVDARVHVEDVLVILDRCGAFDAVFPPMVKVLEKSGSVELTLSPSFLIRQIDRDNREARLAMVDLIGLSGGNEMIPILVSIICNAQQAELHERASIALSHVTEERAA